MRRFHASLLAAGLVAAPVGAVAKPSDPQAADVSIVEKKGRLGIAVMSLSPELRTFFGSTDKTGVLVARVEPGSPAAFAGLAVGDVIVSIQDTKVDDASDLLMALSNVGEDQRVSIRVLRDRKPVTLDVKLGPSATSMLEALPGFRWLREMFDHRERPAST